MALDRLMVKIAPDRLIFSMPSPNPEGSIIEIGGPDHPEIPSEDLGTVIVEGFKSQGVDASAELPSIVQAIHDYRSTRL